MKLLFAGTPHNAAVVLQALNDSAFEVVGVLTREDAITGRNKILTPSPVAALADTLGIPVIKANQVTSEVLSKINELGADLGVVVAYGVLLKPEALAAIPNGWVNLHYSLLPDWRGAAPAQRAILAGDVETGVTLFQIDAGLDTGPVWGQVPTQINPSENSFDLLNRLTQLGISLLLEKLPLIAAGIGRPTPQVTANPVQRLAKKLVRTEAEINWNQSAEFIDSQIRAFNPEPVAFTQLQGQPFRILLAKASETKAAETRKVGTIVVDAKSVYVVCADQTRLELLEVQPNGKKPMAAKDWANGLKVDKLG